VKFSENFVGLRKQSKEKILNSIKDTKDIFFLKAWGNIGDELIYRGAKRLLQNIEYKEIELKNLKDEVGELALVSGSGGWTRQFHKLPSYLAKVETQFNRVIVLPSTYDVSFPYIRQILGNSKAKFFARDITSYNQIMNLCDAELALDCAFFFDFVPFENDECSGILNAFRSDQASIWKELPPENVDISINCKSLTEWLTTIAKHKIIRTDRAHVMLSGAMQGKYVEFTTTRDHKLPSIAEYALKDFQVYRIPDPKTYLPSQIFYSKKSVLNDAKQKIKLFDTNILEQFADFISTKANRPLRRFRTWTEFLKVNIPEPEPLIIIDEGIRGLLELDAQKINLNDKIKKIFKIILLDEIQAFNDVSEIKDVAEIFSLPFEFTGITRDQNGNKSYISVLSSSLPQNLLPPPEDFLVTAIISTYNESDIIEQTIDYLTLNHIYFYLIDNWSTDGTYEKIHRISSEFLVGIERWPETGPSDKWNWIELLKRKEALTQTINSDWFIHYDSDEIRESPWLNIGLREGFWVVDQQGYNAVDFTLINFQPIDNNFTSDTSFMEYFKYFEFGKRPGHFRQIKAWKKGEQPVNIHESYGHNISFQGRKIYPLKFLLRHYPIRSQQHAKQKIFNDRKPRYVTNSSEKGWNSQYSGFTPNDNFLKSKEELFYFDKNFYQNHLIERLTGIGTPGRPALGIRHNKPLDYYIEDKNSKEDNIQNLIRAYRKIHQQKNTIIKLRSEINEKDQKIYYYSESKSWKITRPLRRIMCFLRKLTEKIP